VARWAPLSLAAGTPGSSPVANWTGRLSGIRLIPAAPLAALALMIVVAVAAPILTPHDPVKNDLPHSLMPPAWVHGGSAAFPLGTDTFGRDVLTRLMYGARVSLGVAALSLLIASTIGVVVGLIAGYAGGWLGSALMRLADIILALPMLLVALAIAVAVGPSFTNIVLLIGFMLWPRIARLIRADTLTLKQTEFVRYASAIGVPNWIIVIRHVLPNVMPTLLVATTLEVGHVVLVEAALSFLGAGLPPPQPSWGVMVADGRALIATGWWIALFPGLAITICVLTFNLLGDWLRDRLDPKLKAG
jgi:peptide/nickel transport system permease protein